MGLPLYTCQKHKREDLKHRASSWTGIDVDFGQLSYSQAKLADLAFIGITGRGYTALFAHRTYRVSLKAISKVAEVHCIFYETFTGLVLYSAKIDILLQLIRGLLKCLGSRPKLMIARLFLSIIYVAALPSLFNIMTSYESLIYTESFLPGHNSIKITINFTEGVWTSKKVDENVGHNYTNSYFAATLDASLAGRGYLPSLYSYHEDVRS